MGVTTAVAVPHTPGSLGCCSPCGLHATLPPRSARSGKKPSSLWPEPPIERLPAQVKRTGIPARRRSPSLGLVARSRELGSVCIWMNPACRRKPQTHSIEQPLSLWVWRFLLRAVVEVVGEVEAADNQKRFLLREEPIENGCRHWTLVTRSRAL